jgi:hypothetical protein
MYLKSRRGVCPYLRGWFTHGAAQIRRGITFGGGAPLARRDFRPTGAISGDKSNPTHTRALWIEGHDVPEITTRGLALFCVDGSRTERLKSGAVLRLEVVRPWRAEIFALPFSGQVLRILVLAAADLPTLLWCTRRST